MDRKVLVAAAMLMAIAQPVFAQSEEELDEVAKELDELLTPLSDPTDDWRVRRLFTGRNLKIYGQISQGALGYDDGSVYKTYAPVDNSNSVTRLGLLYDFRPLFELAEIGRLEIGLSPRPSSSVSLLDPSGRELSADIRKLEIVIETKRLGSVTIGQGSMATDSIAEIDFSRTSVAAYSDVGSMAGGQFLRRRDGTLSPLTIGRIFDNFDGDRVTGQNSDGSRKVRLRYDTRRIYGFKASAAAGVSPEDSIGDNYVDGALRYARDTEKMRFSAGLGYSYKSGEEVLSGSMTYVDRGSGLGATIAAGRSSQGGSYGFFKLSFTPQIFEIGKSAVSVDYYHGRDLVIPGSVSESLGIALVQQLAQQGLEAFVTARRYRYSEPTNSFFPSTAVFGGFRWVF